MGELLVIAFCSRDRAEAVRRELAAMRTGELLCRADGVYARRAPMVESAPSSPPRAARGA